MSTTPESPVRSAAHDAGTGFGCPFCALACDDLSPPADNRAHGMDCERARAGFTLALEHTEATPRLAGVAATWDDAVAAAHTLLRNARLPLFHGLLGDLGDARSAWSLAARFGGVVDHRDGDAMARALGVYQDSGWITTSLGEARNRADLIVWVGEPTHDALPRLRERLFECRERLHTDAAPEVVELGARPRERIDHVRTLHGGRPLPHDDPDATQLLEQLRNARYAVFLIGRLADDEADMALRTAGELVRELNEHQRAALLLTGQGPGDVSTQLCGAWRNGFGLRTSLARGYPEQDIKRFAARRLLDDGEADLLVWISSLDATPPPQTRQPQLVFGHPAMRFDHEPAVYLPVAVPGVHRAGFIHRGDAMRLVTLFAMTASMLPDLAALCARLLEDEAVIPC